MTERASLRSVSPTAWTLLGVLILATVLRFYHLGTESLWFDESISVAIAHLDWAPLSRVLYRDEMTMAFYYGLLHFVVQLGETEFLVRSLSAVCGVLTVASFYVLGKRMFGTRVGLGGAVLLAVSPFHITYSQEARGYALVVLLTTLSSLFFINAITNQRRTDWAWYVVTGTLAVYSHLFGVLVLGAHLTALLVLRAQRVPMRAPLISFAVIGFLSVPVAAFLATTAGGPVAGMFAKPGPVDVYAVLISLTGGRLLFWIYFAGCLAAVVVAARTWRHSGASSQTWFYEFLLSWLLVPLLGALVISMWKPLFIDRYLIVCLPPLILLAAVGVSQLRPAWLPASALAVLLILSGRAVVRNFSHVWKEDWRGATSYVGAHALPNDGILLYVNASRSSFEYYARRLRLTRIPKIVFPDPWDWTERPQPGQPSDSVLALLPERYDRIWLVLSHNERPATRRKASESIEEFLSVKYQNVVENRFRGVRVLSYSTPK